MSATVENGGWHFAWLAALFGWPRFTVSMYINMIFMFLINALLYDNLRVCVYDIFANATAFRR